ncbi:MAG: putative 2OG-Fe(II) oxygenase, partial [Pacificimonas sp.]
HRASLLDTIRRKRETTTGINRTNEGGWHSDVDLPSWDSPAVAALMAFIADSCDRAVAELNGVDVDWRKAPWRTQAWANVNPPGGALNRLHDHIQMNWQLSGCYYARIDEPAPDAEDKGRLILENHWTGLALATGSETRGRGDAYVPKEGQFVLFPSWQHHRVEPHAGPGDRVTIAINLFAKELERSRFWTHKSGVIERRVPALVRGLRRLTGRRAHEGSGAPWGFDI